MTTPVQHIAHFVDARTTFLGYGHFGEQRMYRLEPAYLHTSDSSQVIEHVIVSAADVPGSGPETYVFACDADGVIEDFGELPGSFRGDLDHDAALAGLGYEVVTSTSGAGILTSDPVRIGPMTREEDRRSRRIEVFLRMFSRTERTS